MKRNKFKSREKDHGKEDAGGLKIKNAEREVGGIYFVPAIVRSFLSEFTHPIAPAACSSAWSSVTIQ